MSRLIQLFDPARHADFLKDESFRSGRADSISFPKDDAAVRGVLTQMTDHGIPVTVQGGRTGIAGNAVPSGGHILNLSAMNRISGMNRDAQGFYCLRVQPGVTLADLNRQVTSRQFDHARQWDVSSLAMLDRFQKEAVSWIWPPDPTEDTASIGGIAVTNARGLCVHAWGRARQHIRAVQGMDAQGTLHEEMRMDDLYPLMGKDGPFWVITELTLRLIPDSCRWGISFFFPEMAPAATFIESLDPGKRSVFEDARPAAIEIMDRKTLEIIETFRAAHPSFKGMPAVDPATAMAVYLELHATGEDALADLAEQLMDAVHHAGGDPDASLAATTGNDLSRLRLLRKAAPHAAGFLTARARRTDDRITRLGYDWVRPWPSLARQIQILESDMAGAGVTGAIYGHAADQCLHVNLVPAGYAEYAAGKDLIRHWTKTAGICRP